MNHLWGEKIKEKVPNLWDMNLCPRITTNTQQMSYAGLTVVVGQTMNTIAATNT